MMKGEEKKVPKGSGGWMEKKRKRCRREKNIYVLKGSKKDVTHTHLFSVLKIINRSLFFSSCLITPIE